MNQIQRYGEEFNIHYSSNPKIHRATRATEPAKLGVPFDIIYTRCGLNLRYSYGMMVTKNPATCKKCMVSKK